MLKDLTAGQLPTKILALISLTPPKALAFGAESDSCNHKRIEWPAAS
jgi:hypothetical protein